MGARKICWVHTLPFLLRRGEAGNRFARDGKVPGPQLGAKQLPGERSRESAET